MFEKLKDILVEEMSINPSDITLDAELVGDLDFNSLELADLVLLCEDRFGVTVSDDDIRTFLTVGDVCKYMERSVQN
mgnify:CR=1 FL=1